MSLFFEVTGSRAISSVRRVIHDMDSQLTVGNLRPWSDWCLQLWPCIASVQSAGAQFDSAYRRSGFSFGGILQGRSWNEVLARQEHSVHSSVEILRFGVAPSGLFICLLVVTLFLVAELIACYVPASRASRVSPMEVLRNE